MALVVPDASVMVKWFLQNEPLAKRALTLHRDIQNKRCDCIIPEFAFQEVLNALTKPKAGFTARRAMSALRQLKELRMGEVRTGPRLWRHALSCVQAYPGLRFFDACYVAIAQSKSGVWLTHDTAALKAVGHLSYVKSLADFYGLTNAGNWKRKPGREAKR
ncbi:MAG: type II toxin-antitoxin system VapC family toxin [Nitrospinota bacterium]